MSDSGKVVVTKSKLDGLANAINARAGKTGSKTIDELVQTLQYMSVGKIVVKTGIKDSSLMAWIVNPDGERFYVDPDANGTFTFDKFVYMLGKYEVHVRYGSFFLNETVLVGTQEVDFQLPNKVFADNTWDEIVRACKTGYVPYGWRVGDSKTMLIDGTEYSFVIIGIQHDDLADGSGKAVLTLQMNASAFGIYPMNFDASNVGGWDSCAMRTTALPKILAKMPIEIQNGIREVTKKTSAGDRSSEIVTSNDKLFLLSEKEKFGTTDLTVDGEGEQYQYYANGSSLLTNANGYDKPYWMRSPNKKNDYTFFATCRNSSAVVEETRYSAEANMSGNIQFAFCL